MHVTLQQDGSQWVHFGCSDFDQKQNEINWRYCEMEIRMCLTEH